MLAHWVNKQTCTVVQKTETLGTFDHKHQLEQINTHYLSQHYHLAVFSNNRQDCLKVVYFKVSVGHMSIEVFKFKIKRCVLSFFFLRKIVEMYPRSLCATGTIAPFKSKFSFLK